MTYRIATQDAVDTLLSQGCAFTAEVWFATGTGYVVKYAGPSLADAERTAREYAADAKSVRVMSGEVLVTRYV